MLVPLEAPSHILSIFMLAERDAHSALSPARAMLQRVPSADTLDLAWSTFALGWTLLRRMHLSEAEMLLYEAQDLFIGLGCRRLSLHCRRALLIVAMLKGADASLQQAWDALAAAYDADDAVLEAARTRIQQAAHLNTLGRYAEAWALLRQVKSLLYAQGTLDDQARLCRVMAIAASHVGEIDYALAQLTASVTYFERLERPLEVAKCYFERGSLLELKGQYDQACVELERALTTFEQVDDQLQIALCEKALGLVHSRLGRINQAIAITLHAQNLFRTLGRKDQVAASDLNLGNITYYSGLFELALALYYRSQRVFDAIGMQYESLIARRNQAMVIRAQGKAGLALDQLVILERVAHERGDLTELANIYQAQADSLCDVQEYAAALECLARAQEMFVQLGQEMRSTECMLDQGWLHLAQHNPEAAVACFVAAHPQLSHRPVHFWRNIYGLGRCAMMRGDSEVALMHYLRASTIVADLRLTLISEHASSGFFQQARQLFNDALELAFKQQDVQAVLTLAEQQHAPVLQRQSLSKAPFHVPVELYADYEQQRQVLRKVTTQQVSVEKLDEILTKYIDVLLRVRHHSLLPEYTPGKILHLHDIRADLSAAYPRGWAVIVYIESNDALLTLSIDQYTARLNQITLDETLRTLLNQACMPEYHRFTYLDLAYRLNPQSKPWSGLSRLAQYLLPAHIQSQLQPDSRLLIVPSRLLHNLPWAALRIDDAWLCQRAIIQLIPTLGLWKTLSTRQVLGADALLIGCSQFGDRAVPLAGVAVELDRVADQYRGSIARLLDRDATRTRLLEMNTEQRLSRYRLIHIASHAQLTGFQGLLAHIKLWDDDLLYDDVAELVLGGSTIVLSTCHGGLGEVLPGEEVLSLSRAFISAGARDVIASLWTTNDDQIVSLISVVYEGLMAGLDAPTAMAYAQRRWIAECLGDTENQAVDSPLIWGGFHVLGAGIKEDVL